MIGRTLNVSTGWTIGKAGRWEVMLLKAGPKVATVGVYWEGALHKKCSVRKGVLDTVPMTRTVAIGLYYSGCKTDGRGVLSVGVWVEDTQDTNPRGAYPITFTDWTEQ